MGSSAPQGKGKGKGKEADQPLNTQSLDSDSHHANPLLTLLAVGTWTETDWENLQRFEDTLYAGYPEFNLDCQPDPLILPPGRSPPTNPMPLMPDLPIAPAPSGANFSAPFDQPAGAVANNEPGMFHTSSTNPMLFTTGLPFAPAVRSPLQMAGAVANNGSGMFQASSSRSAHLPAMLGPPIYQAVQVSSNTPALWSPPTFHANPAPDNIRPTTTCHAEPNDPARGDETMAPAAPAPCSETAIPHTSIAAATEASRGDDATAPAAPAPCNETAIPPTAPASSDLTSEAPASPEAPAPSEAPSPSEGGIIVTSKTTTSVPRIRNTRGAPKRAAVADENVDTSCADDHLARRSSRIASSRDTAPSAPKSSGTSRQKRKTLSDDSNTPDSQPRTRQKVAVDAVKNGMGNSSRRKKVAGKVSKGGSKRR